MEKKYFESREVAQIIGVEERVLRYWATIKVISPAQDTPGIPGKRRQYSFYNLVEGAILGELKKHGVSINLGARALKSLKEKKYLGKDLCLLLISGKNKIEVFIPFKNPDPQFIKIFEDLCKWTPADIDDHEKGVDTSQRSGMLELIMRAEQAREKQAADKKKMFTEIFEKALYSEIGEKIIFHGESMLIIPVHTLWVRLKEKI